MKIWLDFCEPKSVIMLRPLYEKLSKHHDVFITSRDFDSTLYLLERWGIRHIPAGKYGGASLLGKLKSYSNRISELIPIIEKEKPEFLFCITSPEALRISFGLHIPNIMFNDEPRSFGPCTTTFPYVDQVIVPGCIPIEWYLNYGLKKEKIIRFNGIDEVGWLSNFKPDKSLISDLNLEVDRYVVCRTEPTKAGYLLDKMKPHETQLTKIIPKLIDSASDFKFLILTRNEEQFNYLKKLFTFEIKKDIIRIYKGVDQLAHIMFFSKLVITGGGTMVRESALLGVPSIEFFPLETYPQEQFLIDNNFPLKHFHKAEDSIKQAVDFIKGNYKIETFKKIKELENPIQIAIKQFKVRNL
jgi:predicted glycosyltransferase